MKLAIVSALAALSAVCATALPWLEVGTAPVQRAQCVEVGKDGQPWVTVCPTPSNPT